MKKCKGCDRYKECRDSAWSWVFLFLGIIAAIAMRVVAVFIHTNPVYAKVAWYIGIAFFFMFFIYRYNVSRTRSGSIIENELIKKIKEEKDLAREDRKMIGQILCGLTSRKERINFVVIFVLSGIALIIAVIADLVVIKGGS